MNNKIYTVQVLYVEPDGNIKRHRNWGYYFTFEEAEKVIVNNITDIYENNYYNYGLINEVPPGILVLHLTKDTWYKVDYRNSTHNEPLVTRCTKPIPATHRMGLDY